MGHALPPLSEAHYVPRPRPVHGRRVFAELRRSRRRVFAGPVKVQFLPETEAEGAPGRVQFAVPRKVGTAVERNRCRRRLRAVVTEERGIDPCGDVPCCH